MSILLEALRKSEKGQRSREVPTIHTEVPSGSPSQARRTLPIILLIAIALIICGWFVWNQYWVPADENIVIDDGAAISGTDQPSTSVASRDSEGETLKSTEEKGVTRPAVAANQFNGANNSSSASSDRPRTPTESYKPPSKSTRGSQKSDLTDPRQTRRTGIAAPDSAVAAENDSSSKGSESETSTASKASRQDEEYRAIEPIGYWELPDSVREVVPIIKYTVLVYNKNPPDRFVLINGERLGEGDSFQPGLEVKEIRRDGVIFSYRLYQFLVER